MPGAIYSLWKNTRVVFFCYFLSLAGALAMTLPLSRMIGEHYNKSLTLEKIFKGKDTFILGDLIYQLSGLLNPFMGKAVVMLLLFFLLITFFSGGIVDAVINGETKFKRFIIHSKRFWGNTFQLAILCFIFLVIGGIFAILIGFGIDSLFAVPNYRTRYLSIAIPLSLLAIFYILTLMVWDYSRVLMHSRKYKIGIIKALKLIFSNPYPIFSFIILLLLLVLGLVVFRLFSPFLKYP